MRPPVRLRGLVSLPGAAWMVAVGTVGAALSLPQAPASKPKATDPFATKGVAFVKKYCAACHTPQAAMGGVTLTKTLTTAQMIEASSTWNRVAKNLKSLHMPPKGSLQPTKAERDAMVVMIETSLAGDCDLANPGRVTLRRLNREEYNNTVRDLLGLDLRLADDFPSDDVGYGFDNIGDVLTLSPLLMEKVLSAAETIATAAVVVPNANAKRVMPDQMTDGPAQNLSDENKRLFFSAGRSDARFDLKTGGRYRIQVRASAQQAGNEPARMALWVNDQMLTTFDVANTPDKPQTFAFTAPILKGNQRVGVSFVNDYYNPSDPPNRRDRNLLVDWIELVGPEAVTLPESHRRLIPNPPTDKLKDARRALSAFALRAYRRPATTEEADRLVEVYKVGEKMGGSYEAGIQLGVQAILSSPHFLYKVETEPKAATAKERALTGYELATRLSYFLWSSAPDDRLLALAGDGSLLKPETLRAETLRMLGDPKARALADNFAGQWLQLRKLQTSTPDPKTYPDYDESLKRSMVEETKRFFMHVLAEDRPITDFLGAQYSFMNEELAKHYGITGVQGPEFRRVSLAGTPRRGVLTQASVLTVTSNPTRTSPVRRGKWVLENILGAPPPPPPPGVGDLSEDKKITSSASLRQRMEEHRKNPACANCHKAMDALGFSLENFDGVGQWRTRDGEFAIDSSGELPDGSKVAGPSELSVILLRRKDEFTHALADKMLTYALGRGIVAADKCFVDEVAKKTSASGDRFRALITAVVLSEPFRNRATDRIPAPKKP